MCRSHLVLSGPFITITHFQWERKRKFTVKEDPCTAAEKHEVHKKHQKQVATAPDDSKVKFERFPHRTAI